jgi:hypothetical protein
MGESFYRSMPPYVSQDENYLCWAAALESWLRAVPHRPNMSQIDLLDEATQAGVVGSNGSLYKQGLVWISNKFHMTMKVFGKQKTLTSDYLVGKLKKKGYIYFVWNPLGQVAHTQVVWGVDSNTDVVAYMDPWQGEGWNSQYLSDYYWEDTVEFVVGYPSF